MTEATLPREERAHGNHRLARNAAPARWKRVWLRVCACGWAVMRARGELMRRIRVRFGYPVLTQNIS